VQEIEKKRIKDWEGEESCRKLKIWRRSFNLTIYQTYNRRTSEHRRISWIRWERSQNQKQEWKKNHRVQKFLQVSLSLCWKRSNRVSNRFQQVHAVTLRSWRDHGQASSWFDYVSEAARNCYWMPLWEVWWKMCNMRFLCTSLHTCASLWWVQLRILPRLMCYLWRSGKLWYHDRQWYLYRNETEMKKEQRVESKKNREWICLYREAEDEIHALLHYWFCLSVYITHPQFIYAVLERYHTENVHSI